MNRKLSPQHSELSTEIQEDVSTMKFCTYCPEAVICKPPYRCEKCGWHPDTARRRLARVLARLGVQMV